MCIGLVDRPQAAVLGPNDPCRTRGGLTRIARQLWAGSLCRPEGTFGCRRIPPAMHGWQQPVGSRVGEPNGSPVQLATTGSRAQPAPVSGAPRGAGFTLAPSRRLR